MKSPTYMQKFRGRLFWIRRVEILLLTATFALGSTLTSTTAFADSTIKVSFVLINPLTGLNAGAGNNVGVRAVNRNGGDPPNVRTNDNGVVTFTIKPQRYTLGFYCNICYSNGQAQPGTNYLVIAKSDGSVEVLSADGEPVIKDASGNWMLTTKAVRKVSSNDPWQLMTTKPNLERNTARVAWLLTNGKILVQTTNENQLVNWWTITPDIHGNYFDGTWKQVARIPDYNPWAYNGAILHSGNFFVTGGEVNFSDAGVLEENNNKSYIYNVSANTWSQVAPPNNGQGDWSRISAPPFVELANGQIMIGNWDDSAPGRPHESMLFDETTLKWTLTGTNKTGQNMEAGFTLLQNDKVLTVNTDWGSKSAEIYDPATGLWAPAGTLPEAISFFNEIGPALSLPNGKVLAQGATGANALYDPATNSWSSVPSFPKLKNGLQLSAPDNPAAILPNGNLLTVIGHIERDTDNQDIMGPAKYLEYDWMSNTWLPVIDDPMASPASSLSTYMKLLPLPNGQIMAINMGANPGSGGIAFYTSKGVPNSSWAPVVDKVSDTAFTPGKSYEVSGKQLSGLTQGAQFGDEFESATNYPLVRIVNDSTQHVFYGFSSGFSTTSIAPMVQSTFNFTIGTEVENGPSHMYVVANGIASTPIAVTVLGATAVTLPTPTPIATSTPTPVSNQSKPVITPVKKSLKTIVCVKASTSKKISGINPKCPSGYKIKK